MSSCALDWQAGCRLADDKDESRRRLSCSSNRQAGREVLLIPPTPCSPPHSERWAKEETELFFRALRHVGTDFTLLAQLFPKRDRKHIKNKVRLGSSGGSRGCRAGSCTIYRPETYVEEYVRRAGG